MRDALSTVTLALGAAVILSVATARAVAPRAAAAAAPDPHAAVTPARGTARIPESLREEHEEIHVALVRATKLEGAVGEAARALAKVLHPHFVREEQIALPPLGLLAPLARGPATAEMRDVLAMTDALRAELPRMLEEHRAISEATRNLGEAARAARNARVVELAAKLLLHARGEEEIFYPAAILVGDLVRGQRG